MVGRFNKNIFKYIGEDFGMIGTLFGFPSNDKDEFGTQMNKIGSQYGGFLRDIYGFEKEQILEDEDELKNKEEEAEKLKEETLKQ